MHGTVVLPRRHPHRLRMTSKTRFVTDPSRHRQLTPDANATDAGALAGSDAHGISQRMRAVLMTALVEIINTKDLRPSEAASFFGVPQASIRLLACRRYRATTWTCLVEVDG
jgi:predicted XRE-type DNA-binding protein